MQLFHVKLELANLNDVRGLLGQESLAAGQDPTQSMYEAIDDVLGDTKVGDTIYARLDVKVTE